jgi:hypothetical protein
VEGANCSTAQIGSTPSRDRCPSMKATTSCAGGRAPPRRKSPPLGGLVRPAELSQLFLQLGELVALVGCCSRTVAGVDLGLLHPQPERLGPHAELAGDAGRHAVVAGVLTTKLSDHPHGAFLQLRRVPPLPGVLVFRCGHVGEGVGGSFAAKASMSAGTGWPGS